MRPTDDEYRAVAVHALMALAADVDRTLNGPSPTREATRGLADEIRGLLSRADATLHGETDDLYEIAARARAKVLEVFGTSGWGEDEPPRKLPPLPSSSGRRR